MAFRVQSGCTGALLSLLLDLFAGGGSVAGGEEDVEGAKEYYYDYVTVELETDFREVMGRPLICVL